MADILKSKMVVSGNDIVRFIFILWQFALENCHAVYKCYIELSSLYFKVAKRHENNINFNISLKKNTTTFKFADGLPVAELYAMVLGNKIFTKWKYFFIIYKRLNTPFFRSL